MGKAKHAMTALKSFQAATDPLAALAAAKAVREAADQLELIAVREARASGKSWTRIGELYGLTKQGAQQRFREKN